METTPHAADDRGITTENVADRGVDPEAGAVSPEWEGAVIYTSGGYDRTDTYLAQIVEVSDSGKTVLARLVTPTRVDTNGRDYLIEPDTDTGCYSDEFRLHARVRSEDRVSFNGSYPYIDGDMDTGKRRGSFIPYRGGTLRQTAPGRGH